MMFIPQVVLSSLLIGEHLIVTLIMDHSGTSMGEKVNVSQGLYCLYHICSGESISAEF